MHTEASNHCPESIVCNAAPEVIANSRAYDGKLADVWSSGVMLYVMLFCEYPFERAEDAADPHRFQRVSFPSQPIQRRPQQQLRMLLVLYLRKQACAVVCHIVGSAEPLTVQHPALPCSLFIA